jgi:hypothetical protein
MKWSVPLLWEEGDVWILGGGSSVPKQFGIPDSIIENVVKGISPPSAYSPYMSVLHDKHVIGINVSYLIGTWIDMVFWGDLKFFNAHKERLVNWPGLKVTCHASAERVPWVKYLAKDTKHSAGITTNSDMVSWNSNSGSSAISVAANMGAKRIILLGFDMNYNEGNSRHWHNLYKSATPPNPNRRGANVRFTHLFSFERHLHGFPYIARDAKARGIEIINLSPLSAIKDFPKYTLKEFLSSNGQPYADFSGVR